MQLSLQSVVSSFYLFQVLLFVYFFNLNLAPVVDLVIKLLLKGLLVGFEQLDRLSLLLASFVFFKPFLFDLLQVLLLLRLLVFLFGLLRRDLLIRNNDLRLGFTSLRPFGLLRHLNIIMINNKSNCAHYNQITF